ncbi:unnamed protein product [Arabidopsis lyrata]|uniref:F-box domain-containing protein n=1 Tax=Arabidopsis lyrata subsp. lyrata TaxID=81972 RepID=D7MCM5_ARALL|nr:F-box/kelch-repeat protein At5g39560 [Arabidopsis lyrata subsp. lyrata]EFH45695.1 hypothetical protein ARALYDRAFT_913570 [Arabidopsis lyrata subsp. lyrata]CAH8274946.1 unnamed protein product [Arabidopsis lyrata]|eukprot:XP_002869436.1 F-box/kelch-repeat protein At5g39560 [Arabidopsis lyrata subsp. lyrata]
MAPEVAEKRKKIHQPVSISSLPDEITENILARISRWNYPSLSLVSKSFCSLLSSTQLYKTRSQIGTNETCVYVCLQLPNHPCPSWFILRAKPNQTLTKQRGELLIFKENSSGNVLVPIPSSSSHSPPIPGHSTVAVGTEIYIIGGPLAKPSSSVRILDCRTHTWRDAPNMTVAREDACAVYLDEKIYVRGGCGKEKSANWFEVFDIKTQSWRALRIHDDELRNELQRYKILNAFQGKLYVRGDTKDYTYEPKEGTWEVVKEKASAYIEVWCVIENVIYGCTHMGYYIWYYYSKGRKWKVVKGLAGELGEPRVKVLKLRRVVGIVKYGENLLVMWNPSWENKIRYAEISLETRCNGSEVWGKVEWVDAMLTVSHESYIFKHCVSLSV